MTKFIPPGFNADTVSAGLYKAMGFGEPNGEKVAFFIEKDSDLPASTPKDEGGLPFNPEVKRRKTHSKVEVDCALEYVDRTETTEQFGQIQPSKVVITLLDADYQQIKGFSYVIAGGDQYWYSKTIPPVALGSIDVWTVHATTQDER